MHFWYVDVEIVQTLNSFQKSKKKQAIWIKYYEFFFQQKIDKSKDIRKDKNFPFYLLLSQVFFLSAINLYRNEKIPQLG